MFTTFAGKEFITNYNTDKAFQDLLDNKGIAYNMMGENSFIHNPIKRWSIISGFFVYAVGYHLFDYIYKSRNSNIVQKSGNSKKEDIFGEIILNDDIKVQLNTILDQLKNPQKYKSRGLRLIKGCLLYGTPGNGKTLLARCLSKLDEITFINTCASEFVEIYVGSGPKKIRDIFKIARENKPTIIFIDEIESVGAKRAEGTLDYSINRERYAALNQLLSEMDGINNNDDICIIGATNRPDLLDPAITRPGRFDHKIEFTHPDQKSRETILKLYISKLDYDRVDMDTSYWHNVAVRCEGLTGAELEGIINLAASTCYSHNRNKIEMGDIEEATKQMINDKKKFK